MKTLIDALVLLISDCNEAAKIHCIENISGEDWGKLLKISDQNYLTSYFYYIVKKEHLLDYLPQEAQRELNTQNQRFVLKSLKIRGVFLQVLHWLNEERIDFIVLKGCDVQNRLYNNPSLRRMIDIDILIQPENLEQVTKKILLAGGRKLDVSESEFIDSLKHHEAPLIYKNVAIEFHKSLVDVYETSNLGVINVWDYSKNFLIDGIKVKVMQPEMLIIYLCHHLYSTIQGGKIKLFWYLDIYLFFKKFGEKIDERKLDNILKTSGEIKIFYHVLAQVKAIFPEVSFPEFMVIENTPNTKTEIYEALQAKYVYKPLPHYYEKFKNVEGFKKKFAFLFDKLFPSKSYILNVYKPKNKIYFLMYYVLHQIRILFKGAQAIIYYFYKKKA